MLYRLFSLSTTSRIIAVFIMAGMFALCQSDTTSKKTDPAASEQGKDTGKKSTQKERKLIVYYFHTNSRCHSCITIEKLTRQAINDGFAGQLENGRIEFKAVNIETAGNEHFAQDYELYTKSVILSDTKSGKEVNWKNLEKVWSYLRDEKKFIDYIQTNVNTLL